MKIQLIAVGTKMPAWVEHGFEEYRRRFPKDMPFELVEIGAGKRGKNADIPRILQKEGEAMLAAAGRSRIVTLDIPGKPWTTEQLATQLEAWKLDGRDVALLVGGPEGLSPSAKLPPNRAGHCHRSPCPIRWCGCWWPRASIGPGASPPIIRIIESEPCVSGVSPLIFTPITESEQCSSCSYCPQGS